MLALSFWAWTNSGLAYAVNVIFFVGGIFTTARFFDHRHKQAERGKEEAFKVMVDRRVEGFLSKNLDDAVDDAVAISLQEQLVEMTEKLDWVYGQTKNNGGSSMKDSQARVEEVVTQILTNQAVQNKSIATLEEVSLKTVDTLSRLGNTMEYHLGTHNAVDRMSDSRSFDRDASLKKMNGDN